MQSISLTFIFISCNFIYAESSLQDIVFPPPLINSEDPNTPTGHLKPLGWQRPADGPVTEYDHILSTQEYWDKHVSSRTPCVFRQAIKNSPALTRWMDDEYLKSKYGELDVLVELKRENRTFSTGRLRFGEFIDRYKKDDLYVVTMLPKAMMHEIQAINSVLCGTFKNFTHESNFWMSNGGTRSVIHYDADHNLHCMIAGRKDLIMVKNTQQNRKWLYMSAKPVTAGSGYSPLNPDIIDLKKHPNYAKVPWLYTTILPGDCVYIPAIYIHQVRAYGRSLSATTLFTEEIIGTQKHFTSEGCSDEKLNEYRTMDDIDFHWTYEKGDQTIDMGYMNIERLRHIVIDHIKESGMKKWGFKSFREFFVEFSHGEAQNDAKEVWTEILGHKMGDRISNATVKSYTREQLKLLARSFDPPHGPKTNGLEEVSFLPGGNKKDEDRGAESLDRLEGAENDDDDDDDDNNDNNEDDNGDDENEDDKDDESDEGRNYETALPDLVYDEEQRKEQPKMSEGGDQKDERTASQKEELQESTSVPHEEL